MIILQALASLALRFALALPFWQAGLLRWEGFLRLRPETVDFYANAYRPILGGTAFTVPEPDIVAMVLSFAEILLPAALVIGFATRFSALGLLIMTGILFAAGHSGILFPGYPAIGLTPDFWHATILPWGAMALALVAYGPGLFSFDRLIWESVRR